MIALHSRHLRLWPTRAGWQGAAVALALMLAALLAPVTARADTPTITVTAEQDLRFGSFVVPSNGTRTISANGVVSDNGVLPAGNSAVGPAQFTVTYDRGNESKQSITILVQLLLAGDQTVIQGGVSGKLSSFENDLPNLIGSRSGTQVIFTIDNCRVRLCQQTFHIGARLDVTRASGGAALTIPLPVTATVLAVY